MDKKPTLVVGWFLTATTTLILAFILLIYLSTDKVVNHQSENFKLYSALPVNNDQISIQVDFADGRALIIGNFFKGHASPLQSLGSYFVQAADKYKLDFRLLPAIAMQESLGGKKIIRNSFNPFGYGIYGDKVIKFSSWEEAIDKVAKALQEDYLNQGLKTPDKIMAKYTPPALKRGGDWAKGVNSFMQQLQ